MRSTFTAFSLVGAACLVTAAPPPLARRDVDTRFPYTGPKVPVGDWVDPTVNGNGKGFPRLVEAPAVKPSSSKPSNNINVISVSYIPDGVNIHFQTPFGLGSDPTIHWGESDSDLSKVATGSTSTYVSTLPILLLSSNITWIDTIAHPLARNYL